MKMYIYDDVHVLFIFIYILKFQNYKFVFDKGFSFHFVFKYLE